MHKAARKYDRIVQCGHQNRSMPENVTARDYIKSGKMGTLSMGCTIDGKPDSDDGVAEPSATLSLTGPDTLTATTIAGGLVPRALDELPVAAILATQARGRTVIRDAAELRVKESDRITAVVESLAACGVAIEATADGLVIDGPQQIHGGDVFTRGDHRIAMGMAIAALWADGPITIHGGAAIATSFPSFLDVLHTVAPGATPDALPRSRPP